MTPDDLEELAVGKYGLTEVGRGERKMAITPSRRASTGTTKVEQTFTEPRANLAHPSRRTQVDAC
jgi:hypothetical protein